MFLIDDIDNGNPSVSILGPTLLLFAILNDSTVRLNNHRIWIEHTCKPPLVCFNCANSDVVSQGGYLNSQSARCRIPSVCLHPRLSAALWHSPRGKAA